MLKSLQNEDWVATIMGGLILLLVVVVPSVMKNFVAVAVIVALLAYLGYLFMGKRDRGQFLLSFVAIFLLAWLSRAITATSFIKSTGFESVFFAVIIGLLIRNTLGLPKWLAPAAVANITSRQA